VEASGFSKTLGGGNQVSRGGEKKSPERANLRPKGITGIAPANNPHQFPSSVGLEDKSTGDLNRNSISNAPMLSMKPNASHPEKNPPRISAQERFGKTRKMLKRLETQNADAEDTSCVVTKNEELPPQRNSIGPRTRQNPPEQETLGLRVSSVPTLTPAIPENFQKTSRQTSKNPNSGIKGGLVRQIAQTDWIQLSSKNDQSESNAIGIKKNQQTIFLENQKIESHIGHAKFLAEFTDPVKPEKKVNRYRKTVVEP
jgi:hypothetical protein